MSWLLTGRPVVHTRFWSGAAACGRYFRSKVHHCLGAQAVPVERAGVGSRPQQLLFVGKPCQGGPFKMLKNGLVLAALAVRRSCMGCSTSNAAMEHEC